MSALLQAKGIGFWNPRLASKNFQALDVLQVALTAPIRSLKVRGGRPLASERNLIWEFEKRNQKFQTLDFFAKDSRGAHN